MTVKALLQDAESLLVAVGFNHDLRIHRTTTEAGELAFDLVVGPGNYVTLDAYSLRLIGKAMVSMADDNERQEAERVKRRG